MIKKEDTPMAKGNTYRCLACGAEYKYCPKCSFTKPTYDMEVFCSKKHAKIFEILSKHGCGLATAEDTLDALKPYDISGLSESIQAHMNTLQEEAQKEVEAPTQEQLLK